MPLCVLFCSANGPKPKEIKIYIMFNEQKCEIITLEKLKSVNICLKILLPK